MMQFDDKLINKYSVAGPRYTSYPTAPIWQEIDSETQKSWLQDSINSSNPLSLYVHVPFCPKRCHYCGCNVILNRDPKTASGYVDYLLREIEVLGEYLGKEREVIQLHFGGGTPTFLEDQDLTRILNQIRSVFPFEQKAEISIEVSPNTIRDHQLQLLSELGFNRVSFGVQDLNPEVQKEINRIQHPETTRKLLEEARSRGFQSVNFDLIYGLPKQTEASFQETLAQVQEMRPDRLAVYNFAFLPEQFPGHKNFRPEDLPDAKMKLNMMLNTIQSFQETGYRYIGMDHFALPEDELSIAQQNRVLSRNFMGYTPKSNMDMFGLGASSIGNFAGHFVQNAKDRDGYENMIASQGIAGIKGLKLSEDDLKRQWVITQLICNFYLSFDEYNQKFQADFKEDFASSINELHEMIDDGLLQINEDHIQIENTGILLVRNICMKFDAYLKKSPGKAQFSKTL